MLTEAHSSLELLMYSTSVTIYIYMNMGVCFQFLNGLRVGMGIWGVSFNIYGEWLKMEAAQLTG